MFESFPLSLGEEKADVNFRLCFLREADIYFYRCSVFPDDMEEGP